MILARRDLLNTCLAGSVFLKESCTKSAFTAATVLYGRGG